jgi:addiction module HigA family antidote
MLPEKRIPTHPGEVLLVEFLDALGMSQVEFAAHLGIPIQRVNEIIKGKRGVTPDTAWLFSQALGTSPEFWLNLQAAHDLAKTHPPTRIARVSRLESRRKKRRGAPESTPRAARG